MSLPSCQGGNPVCQYSTADLSYSVLGVGDKEKSPVCEIYMLDTTQSQVLVSKHQYPGNIGHKVGEFTLNETAVKCRAPFIHSHTHSHIRAI